MQSKRTMRRVILSRLFDHLEECYGTELAREPFVTASWSLPKLDQVLAFKSDPRLDELRGALVRLEAGTFGTCVACRGPIASELIERDPARRVCAACEEAMSHVQASSLDASVPAFL